MRSTRHASVLPALILLLPALGACISSEPELTRKKLLERVPKSALALDSDVAWLSDDAREGRRAGMQGERDTAAWLARQLGAIGLEPAGADGYFQRFPVPLAARVGDAPSVSKEVRLASGQRATVRQRGAMEPLFCSTSGEVTGSLVFRGYGIVDEEREVDRLRREAGNGHVAQRDDRSRKASPEIETARSGTAWRPFAHREVEVERTHGTRMHIPDVAEDLTRLGDEDRGSCRMHPRKRRGFFRSRYAHIGSVHAEPCEQGLEIAA